MHVTLAQWQRLSAEEKAKVTSIDASIVDDLPRQRPYQCCSKCKDLGDDWDYSTTGSIPNEDYGR